MHIDNLRKRLNEEKCNKNLFEVFWNQKQPTEKIYMIEMGLYYETVSGLK